VSEIASGTRIGEFELDSLIGRGPLSDVYRATQPALQRVVALKVLRSDVGRDDTFRRRFVREGRILAQLEHENIVRVYEAGVDGEHVFLAVELIEGETVADLLARQSRLSVEDVVRILTPVAAALDHAHRSGVVHRDVQSSNVLITREGAVYLSDFALARSGDSLLTTPGKVVGKLRYLAPEQIRGEPIRAETDVYSMGCMTFECLTGELPFADKQGMRILWAHLQDEVPSARVLRPALPAAVDDVLRRAMAKDPDDRHPTAGAFVADLASALPPGRARPVVRTGAEAPTAAKGPIEPGTSIGRFEVETMIGAGAMGWVYRARQRSLDRVVALKVLRPHLSSNPLVVARFEQEGVSLARLRHRHIVAVYGAGRDRQHLFLAMQFIDGTTLAELIGDRGRLPPELALPIIGAVAEALDHAHGERIVHRDVKPANILLARDGRVYLSDFGITRTLERAADLTATGGVVGTPLYMAPEQADPDAEVGSRADVYGLGCVAFECLTGAPPFERPTSWALLMAHAVEDVPRASELATSLPTALDAVFATAMAKAPEDRYATAGELAAALRDLLL
jgi:serine/threonine-protein kinase